jgi:hypothetical protein
MGSFIEINDTLQITREQGFPAGLVLDRHLTSPYDAAHFEGRIFNFRDKPEIRIFHRPPVRVFLVESVGGKWIYWGLCEVLSVSHDYARATTSGTFRITYVCFVLIRNTGPIARCFCFEPHVVRFS